MAGYSICGVQNYVLPTEVVKIPDAVSVKNSQANSVLKL